MSFFRPAVRASVNASRGLAGVASQRSFTKAALPDLACK